MKQIILTLMIAVVALGSQVPISAQTRQQRSDAFLFDDDTVPSDSVETSDIIKVRYEKKDAHLAMLYSVLLPGAGQYYADRSSITTYLFPVLEIGLIAGIFYYNNNGNDLVKKYERYANVETVNGSDYDNVWDAYTGPRYRREYQTAVQNALIGLYANDIYDSEFFRLDAGNTQHFYEDIGKYNKYVFGWVDWYSQFAADASGTFVLDLPAYNAAWIWSYNPLQPQDRRWLGNIPIASYNPANPGTDYIPPGDPSASPMRAQYIRMRNDAKDQFSIARLLTFGVALNHLGSGLDAVRLVGKRNRSRLAGNDIQLQYYTSVRDDKLLPMVGLNWKF